MTGYEKAARDAWADARHGAQRELDRAAYIARVHTWHEHRLDRIMPYWRSQVTP